MGKRKSYYERCHLVFVGISLILIFAIPTEVRSLQPQITAGGLHTVGLKSDGTVVAVGNDRHPQLNVSDWTDIVQVSAGEGHTVGLKSDGTVVAAGYNKYGQLNVRRIRGRATATD